MSNSNLFDSRKSQVFTYLSIRIQNDIEFAKFKKEQDKIFDAVKQTTAEECLSIRRLNDSRIMYERSLNHNVNINQDQMIKNILPFVYDTLTDTQAFGVYSANLYKEKEHFVIEYYKAYFEYKQNIKSFKADINEELREYKNKLKNDGFPTVYLPYLYKKYTTELGLIKQFDNKLEFIDSSEYKFFNDIYDDLIDAILKEVVTL